METEAWVRGVYSRHKKLVDRAMLVLLVVGIVMTTVGLAMLGAFAPQKPTHTGPPPAIAAAVATAASVQQSGTAILWAHYQTVFYQNTTAMYGAGSNPVYVPSDLAGAAYGSVLLSNLLLVFSMHNGYVPMTNVTQGTANLANATVPYSFSVSPAVSATPVKVRIPAAFTSTGATPAVAHYPVYLNATTEVSYILDSSANWTFRNGTTDNLTYSVTPPAGYYLNSTTTFVPFPIGTPVNTTTLNITLGSVAFHNYQYDAGGVYLFTTGSTTAQTFHVRFKLLPTTVGLKAPAIPLGYVYELGNGQYQANASWVNPYTVPYGGLIVITTNLSYTIASGSLAVTANGKTLGNASFVLAGETVQILAGAVSVNPSAPIVFQLTFKLVGVPPSLNVFDSTRLGDTGATVGDLLAALGIILIFMVFVEMFSNRKRHAYRGHEVGGLGWSVRNATRVWWIFVYLFVADVFLYVVFIKV
jgi:uncharacterized membrane protein